MPNPRRDDARRSPPRRTESRRDAGAYIGRLPERAPETNAGAERDGVPQGHREATANTGDAGREAGQRR